MKRPQLRQRPQVASELLAPGEIERFERRQPLEVRTGLVLLGTDAYIQDAFVGLVIVLAVIVNIKLTDRRDAKG